MTTSSRRVCNRDLFAVVFICIVAGALLFWITDRFRLQLITMSIGGRWFQSDGWRVYDDMTSYEASHYRNNLRPLFSLITVPFTKLLAIIFGVRPIDTIWLFNFVSLSLWGSGIYVTCRLIGTRTVSAFLFSLLGLSSSAALFWFSVPETYGLSSLVLVLSLLMTAVHIHRPVSNAVWILTGGLLAGTLITNWMIIVLLAFTLKPRRDAILISIVSILLFFGGWAAQKIIFPAPAGFPGQTIMAEGEYVHSKDQGGVLCALEGELVSSILAPEPKAIGEPEPTGHRLSMQCAKGYAVSPAFAIAAGIWLALLIYGGVSMARNKYTSQILLAWLAVLGYQVGLHVLYGEETFLYALHFAPLMILISAGGFLSDKKPQLIWVLTCLIVFAALNNISQLAFALNSGNSGHTDSRIVQRLIF